MQTVSSSANGQPVAKMAAARPFALDISIICHPISSKFYICVSFIKLSLKFEYGSFSINDHQDVRSLSVLLL